MKGRTTREEIRRTMQKFLAEHRRDGLHQDRYPNGKLRSKWRRVDGKIEGLRREWHKNGRLAYEALYKNGVIEGSAREWHENGKIAREMPYKIGVIHGTVKQWSRKGKLLGEYEMKWGKGIEFKWDEDGSLESEYEKVFQSATSVVVYDDLGKPHTSYRWNGKQVSRKKFQEELARAKR